MTDIQANIMEIKQTLKAMQADVTTKPFDWWNEVPPPPKANPNKNELIMVPDDLLVYKPHNDEYIGGPVAGYCPDYMKEKK